MNTTNRTFRHGVPVVLRPTATKADLAMIDEAYSLYDVDHVEMWVEHTPSRADTAETRAVVAGRDIIIHGPFIGMSLSQTGQI